jgi:ubiquitin carboxyl-terminal hydrolase 4/11/15
MGMMFAQIAGNQKNSAWVDYPIEGLDARPFVLSLKDEPEPVLYDLYAVSNHFGSLNGGHYTATCLNPIHDKWYYFDDSRVQPAHRSQIVSPAGYILFYRRRE